MCMWRAAFVVLLCSSMASARVYDNSQPEPKAFPAPGVLIVEYNLPATATSHRAQPGAAVETGLESLDRIYAKYGVYRVQRLFPDVSNPRYARQPAGYERFVRVSFPADQSLAEVRAALAADGHVASAEYAMVQPVLGVPNDPSFGSQWSYQNSGDHDMDAPEAWDVEPGDSIIILGATDTGVQYDHPDLAGPAPYTGGNIFINWSEYNGVPGVDDDGNGFVDDIRGWDFVDVAGAWPGEDGTNPDNDPMDFNGHGTHVSGIMAAMTNNAVGVAGTAGGWYGATRGCKIMPLRIGWSQAEPTHGYEAGYVRMDFAAQAFNYGVSMGVKVFNCSWGSSSGTDMRVATDNAVAQGVTICAAAGNENTTTSGYLQRRSDVITVASTTSSDRKSGFSSYGADVDVSAPGSSIYNTYSNHGSPTYAYLSGTSMATPHVAGLVGLIRSRNPELEKDRVDSIAIHTADDIYALNPGFVGLLGAGRINAANAIAAVPFADFAADVTFGQAPLAVQYTDHSYLNPVAWDWDLGNGETPAIPSPATVYSTAGVYTVSLTTQSDAGLQTTTKSQLIRVVQDSVGGLASEVGIFHSGSVALHLSCSVPVDSLVIPFEVAPVEAISLDTVLLDGDLAGSFTTISLDNFLAGAGMGVLRFVSDTGAVTLPPGALASFHFSVGQGIPGNAAVVDTTGLLSDAYAVFTPYGTYAPDVVATRLQVAPYLLGDVSLDGSLTSSDVIQMVSYVFKGGILPEPDLADVDASGSVSSADILYMVNYLFKGGPPPVG